MTWRGAGLSDIGRARTSNQDAFAVVDRLGLWIVADGMGGHPAGDVASRLAVEAITACLESDHGPGEQRRLVRDKSGTLLRRAIEASNRAIREKARTHPEFTGMGTTVVVLRIASEPRLTATVAHVGDSRAYLLRARSLLPLTRDHSVVEERIQQGLLSPQQAIAHPLRHVLTRALGTDPQVEPDISSHPLQSDDLLLICTDGLTRMLTDEKIRDIVLPLRHSLNDACRALVNAANQRGGGDNVTIVLVSNQPDS